MKRRVKFLRISAELLADFLKQPVPPGITSEGLPTDARITNTAWEADLSIIRLTLESDSFPEVRPGEEIPQMSPLYFHREYPATQTLEVSPDV